MRTAFEHSGYTVRVGTEAPEGLDPLAGSAHPKGLVHLAVDHIPLGSSNGPVRLMQLAFEPSYARAIASAILSAATEART